MFSIRYEPGLENRLIPTIYEDTEKFLHGNGGPVPSSPCVLVIEGVSRVGQVGRVEEGSNAVVIGTATFDGPRIFVHAFDTNSVQSALIGQV